MSLEMALRDNGNLSSELSELRENNSRTINQLKAEYSLDMAHEKDKAVQDYTDAKEKFEKERAELESRSRQQAEAQQNRLLELDKQVRTLLESKHALEVRVAEIGTRLETSEKELEEKIQECERLRLETHNMDVEKQEALKTLNKHLVRLGALDQEVHDKGELIASLQKQLEIQTSQRASIELSFKDAQAAADRAEERSKSNDVELVKCRQSIEKLQAELRTCKAKVKLKGQMASQQDNLLLERQTAIDRTLHENNTLKQEVTVIKEDNDSLKKKVEELKSKLHESQELQQSNQQMIQWLNQQLTDAQLGRSGPANSVSSRYTLRPNLSFLSGADTMSRGTSHVGPSFSASASLNGALSCTTYKSMLRSSSPFGQSGYSKSVGTSASNGNISTLTSKSARPAGGSSSALCTSSGALKVYKPLTHLIPKAELSGGIGGAAVSTKSAAGVDKLNSTTMLEDSTTSAGKLNDPSWTLLPRPPLSFVEARSELLNLTAKNQGTFSNKNGLSSGEDAIAHKAAVHADSFPSKATTKAAASQ